MQNLGKIVQVKLNAARRLLAAEEQEKAENPQEESLKRRLETQKEKPSEEQSFGDKRAILDTQEQLQRVKEQKKPEKTTE
jgi:hypothetical protein